MRTLSPPAASSSRSASRSVSRPIFVEISAAAEIKGAIDSLVLQHAQALVMPNNSIVDDHRAEIVDAAMKHSLPTMAENVDIVRLTGALAAYGVTLAERDRLRAEYIDRILRGAKPADLPVQQPTKFELAINLKTAKALGITVPQALLLRTDALIQQRPQGPLQQDWAYHPDDRLWPVSDSRNATLSRRPSLSKAAIGCTNCRLGAVRL